MTDYLTNDSRERIKNAANYRDLLAIALEVLEVIRTKHPRKPIAMVCGPISNGGKGSRSENLRIFARAIDRLSKDGLTIFSQMPFEYDIERLYKSDPKLQGLRLLEEFYLPIFQMKFINLLCFLPGWKTSLGASWEHGQAKRLRIPIIYLAESYIED